MITKRVRYVIRSAFFALILLPSAFASIPAAACSPEAWMATLCLFAGNYPIRGWARAEGQLLAISENKPLFSLLGTAYGGDGTTTFALPDLRDRVPVGMSDSIKVGNTGGQATTTLTPAQMPAHSHQAIAKVTGTAAEGNAPSPGAGIWAAENRDNSYYSGQPASTVTMADQAVTVSISPDGGGKAFSNMPPYVGMTWLIKLTGPFPPRY